MARAWSPIFHHFCAQTYWGGEQGAEEHWQPTNHHHVQVSLTCTILIMVILCYSCFPLQWWYGSHWHLPLHPCPARAGEVRRAGGLLPVCEIFPHPPPIHHLWSGNYFLHGISWVWQSWIKIQHYSVGYFDCVYAFKVLCHCRTSVEDGAHTPYSRECLTRLHTVYELHPSRSSVIPHLKHANAIKYTME